MKRIFKILLIIIKRFLQLHLAFVVITSLTCILLNFVKPVTTPLILYKRIVAPYEIKKHRYIKLENIPKYTRRALVVSEDQKYYEHFGFDLEAMKRAYKRNQRLGKVRSGGSTITQQAARSLFLTTHRNIVRKYLEAWVTLEMEIFLSKDRIMELYFNYVEWGKGIFGIETASQFYYHKSAKSLSGEQSKALITILANPIRYNPHNYMNSRTMRMRMNHISRWMNR